ncbi:MAG: DNA polymerase-3 subunit epsilon, partial [Roseivirga sp.]
GFGFFDNDFEGNDLGQLKDIVKIYPDTPDVHRIINQFKEKRQVLTF